jgi:hypothetical protein
LKWSYVGVCFFHAMNLLSFRFKNKSLKWQLSFCIADKFVTVAARLVVPRLL